ncbi:hypothetical protein CMEL01_16779 [Colletotrichum melonis]|uniref:Uncharacterized protein n=1 Tax=Colletotrichum melonis TaxID=1209925 RepID=A0AAI9U369_9PEZI|nr:hypothetical protein CMEL01_16779 [Colletotrichum melonis]
MSASTVEPAAAHRRHDTGLGSQAAETRAALAGPGRTRTSRVADLSKGLSTAAKLPALSPASIILRPSGNSGRDPPAPRTDSGLRGADKAGAPGRGEGPVVPSLAAVVQDLGALHGRLRSLVSPHVAADKNAFPTGPEATMPRTAPHNGPRGGVLGQAGCQQDELDAVYRSAARLLESLPAACASEEEAAARRWAGDVGLGQETALTLRARDRTLPSCTSPRPEGGGWDVLQIPGYTPPPRVGAVVHCRRGGPVRLSITRPPDDEGEEAGTRRSRRPKAEAAVRPARRAAPALHLHRQQPPDLTFDIEVTGLPHHAAEGAFGLADAWPGAQPVLHCALPIQHQGPLRRLDSAELYVFSLAGAPARWLLVEQSSAPLLEERLHELDALCGPPDAAPDGGQDSTKNAPARDAWHVLPSVLEAWGVGFALRYCHPGDLVWLRGPLYYQVQELGPCVYESLSAPSAGERAKDPGAARTPGRTPLPTGKEATSSAPAPERTGKTAKRAPDVEVEPEGAAASASARSGGRPGGDDSHPPRRPVRGPAGVSGTGAPERHPSPPAPTAVAATTASTKRRLDDVYGPEDDVPARAATTKSAKVAAPPTLRHEDGLPSPGSTPGGPASPALDERAHPPRQQRQPRDSALPKSSPDHPGPATDPLCPSYVLGNSGRRRCAARLIGWRASQRNRGTTFVLSGIDLSATAPDRARRLYLSSLRTTQSLDLSRYLESVILALFYQATQPAMDPRSGHRLARRTAQDTRDLIAQILGGDAPDEASDDFIRMKEAIHTRRSFGKSLVTVAGEDLGLLPAMPTHMKALSNKDAAVFVDRLRQRCDGPDESAADVLRRFGVQLALSVQGRRDDLFKLDLLFLDAPDTDISLMDAEALLGSLEVVSVAWDQTLVVRSDLDAGLDGYEEPRPPDDTRCFVCGIAPGTAPPDVACGCLRAVQEGPPACVRIVFLRRLTRHHPALYAARLQDGEAEEDTKDPSFVPVAIPSGTIIAIVPGLVRIAGWDGDRQISALDHELDVGQPYGDIGPRSRPGCGCVVEVPDGLKHPYIKLLVPPPPGSPDDLPAPHPSLVVRTRFISGAYRTVIETFRDVFDGELLYLSGALPTTRTPI